MKITVEDMGCLPIRHWSGNPKKSPELDSLLPLLLTGYHNHIVRYDDIAKDTKICGCKTQRKLPEVNPEVTCLVGNLDSAIKCYAYC